ncbi:four helix bundle protein [Mucilaginibacter sp. UR6-1]|uniref:four helix bundle protein n=1 Tax=Mucilaginibacter sp. UR6-1 TaxID=1435643 RepID=UPI001E4A4662|nr:four helix bundle protein [Mucilaginibacter sp. UR6-1]MCC8411029.1 four helix bundle protein [Mucilaginibacter sp. UR6-1]
MAKFQRFEDLEIWKIAVDIAVEIYNICDNEPLRSDWGMKDQIRRAACSMSDNIAEGFEYNNNPDFIRFLNYAKGSAGEFRNKLIILFKAGKIVETKYNEFYNKSIEFSSKTKALIEYLKKFEADKKRK